MLKNLIRSTLLMAISTMLVAYASAQDFNTDNDTIEFDSHATWHFTNPSSVLSAQRPENRDQNTWYQERAILEAVDTLSFSGIYSVAFKGNPETLADANNFRMSIDNPGTQGVRLQHVVHARVFIPETEVDKINSVIIYDMYDTGGGFDYSQTGYNVPDHDAITPGEWNTITHHVDRDVEKNYENITRLGVRINFDTEYSDDPPMIFVDFISTDPDAPLHPHISPPLEASALNITENSVDLSWNEPVGNDEVLEYAVFRGGFFDLDIADFDEVGRTETTNFTDTGLRYNTDYHYRIVALSTDSLYTDPTEIVWARTEDIEFDTYATWHFTDPSSVLSTQRPENRNQNTWYQERAILEAVDTLSYSGIHSVAFKGNPETLSDANNFRMSIDNPVAQGAQLQQIIHARVLVPESEVEKINNVVLYHMYDTGGGFDYSQSSYGFSGDEAIRPGEWGTITHWINEDRTMRDDVNLVRMGVRINFDTDFADDPPMIFVDFVTTDQNAPLHPHLSPPRNVSAVDITDSSAVLLWEEPNGNDTVEEYIVYRGGFNALELADFDEIGRTGETSFTDTGLESDSDYHYRLVAVSVDGLDTDPTDIVWVQTVESVSTGIHDEVNRPVVYELKGNYPNPFNPTTNIVYQIPEQAEVSLKVYNVTGQLVSTLLQNTVQQAGQYAVVFDASSFASGVYLYRLQAGDFVQTRRMILIK